MKLGSWRRWAAIGVGLGLGVSAALGLPAPETHVTPTPQPPVRAIAGRDLGPVQALFNREADRPRVLVLLSPT